MCRIFSVVMFLLLTFSKITINILAQIIPGTLLPDQPFANMIFKAYSVQTLAAATSFVHDLKMGHYIKVPPRVTLLVWSSFVLGSAYLNIPIDHPIQVVQK